MSQAVFTRFRYEEQSYPRMRGTMIPRSRVADILGTLRPRKKTAPFERAALFVRARYALFYAFRMCGAEKGTTVLLPAYHCITMIEPVLRCGANPRFYRIKSDMSPDTDHVDEILMEDGNRTCCFVLTHYFGFRQNTESLLNCLNSHGVDMIEDCSHMIEPTSGVGDQGKMAVFCPAKLFPIPDGGALLGKDVSGDAAPRLRKRSRGAEAWLLGRLLSAAIDRWSEANPMPHDLSERLVKSQKTANRKHRHETRTLDTHTVMRGTGCTYNVGCEDMLASLWSRKILDRQNRDFVVRARRENFMWWLGRVQRMSGARPVYTELEPDTVPYVFPLVIDSPEFVFDILKHAGMPIYRWDELAQSDCASSEFFRTHLLQLPCHQYLDRHEKEWMAETLQWALCADYKNEDKE